MKRHFWNKKFFNNFTIQQQIFAALLAVTILTTGVLGFSLFAYSRRTIEDQYQLAHKNALQVASRIIQLNLSTNVELSRTLISDDAFMEPFMQTNPGSRSFSARADQEIRAYLLKLFATAPEVRDILVVNSAGNIAFVSVNDYNRRYIQKYFTQDNILLQDWIKSADAAMGREVFCNHNVLFDNGKSDTFSMVKKLVNPSTQNPVGFLVFNIKKTTLDDSFGTSTEGYGTQDYLILDTSVTQDLSASPLPALVYSSSKLSEDEQTDILTAYMMQDLDDKYIFTSYRNAVSGWDVVNVISRTELAQKSRYIAVVAIEVAVVLILFSILLSHLLAKRITSPLNDLEDAILRVGKGNLRVSAHFDNSEVGRIGQQFKDVMNNNVELQDRLLHAEIKERESELLLLQTQINPHYLYNTLDALYFMAIIKNEDEIADFVQALSENFKLSLNKGKKLIPVSSELDRIRAYMKIQNYRYHNRFNLDIQTGEGISDEYILTFILQPLVENSVYHGLEPKPGSGNIWIHARKEAGADGQDLLVFTVEDDGIGIEVPAAVDSGYGINNIRERIRLFYGADYGIRFAAREGGGTLVTIRIPTLPKQEIKEIQKD